MDVPVVAAGGGKGDVGDVHPPVGEHFQIGFSAEVGGKGGVFRPHGEDGATAQVVHSLFFVYLSSLLKRRRARAAVLLSGSRINPGVHSKSRANFALPLSRGQAAKMPPGAGAQGAGLREGIKDPFHLSGKPFDLYNRAKGPHHSRHGPLIILHDIQQFSAHFLNQRNHKGIAH